MGPCVRRDDTPGVYLYNKGMKIIITHSSDLDFENILYAPIMESDLWHEHKILLPQRTGLREQITREMIRDADVVLCEVSMPSTGQGIEIGWATSYGTPIVCFSRKGAKISGALEFVCETFFEYEDEVDMVEKIKSIIKS